MMIKEYIKLYRQLNNLEIVRTRFVEPEWGDKFIDPNENIYTLTPSSLNSTIYWGDQLRGHTWIPPVFDTEYPERSLWKIVDWKNNSFGFCEDGTVMRYLSLSGSENSSIDIALVKAILEQEREYSYHGGPAWKECQICKEKE